MKTCWSVNDVCELIWRSPAAFAQWKADFVGLSLFDLKWKDIYENLLIGWKCLWSNLKKSGCSYQTWSKADSVGLSLLDLKWKDINENQLIG